MKKLSKVLSLTLLFLFLMSLSLTVFASPDILPGDITSTAPGIVVLKAPEQLMSSTTNRKLPISATAPQGTLVTVYRYNYSTGFYQKIYYEDMPLEAVVGATTLFAGQVDLTSGMNKFLIRGATDEETYCVTTFEVNALNEGFMDRIKGVLNVIFS
ncbi:MAG: hypothetical protein IJO50_04685 [Clostridia bacterium]|nr:hypothetical protein [Clostridia bacterium]